MDYPEVALSRKCFKEKLSNEKFNNCCLNRAIEIDFYGLDLVNRKPALLTEEIVKPTDERGIYNLSTNLMGYLPKEFEKIHVLNKDFLFKKWDGSSELLSNQIEFELKPNFPLFLSIDKLKNLEPINISDNDYYLCFRHCPTIVNYWHFEIGVMDNNYRFLKPSRTNIRKMIARQAIELIIENSIIEKDKCKGFFLDFFDSYYDSFNIEINGQI